MDSTNINTFVSLYADFISSLNKYVSHNTLKNIVDDNFKGISIAKTVLSLNEQLKPNISQILNKDDEVFKNDIFVYEDVNISSFWTALTDKQQYKIFKYLNYLYLSSELVLNDMNEKEKEFNPYLGVAEGNSEFSVNNLHSD